jgi:ABC-type nickel/cobalt efflux system permease component RcnA
MSIFNLELLKSVRMAYIMLGTASCRIFQIFLIFFYFVMLSVSRLYSMSEQQTRNYLEGSSHGLTMVLSWHLMEGLRKTIRPKPG